MPPQKLVSYSPHICKSPELLEGVTELEEGTTELDETATELEERATELEEGATELDEAATELEEGTAELELLIALTTQHGGLSPSPHWSWGSKFTSVL